MRLLVLLFILSSTLFTFQTNAQRVGVVLSGGGATGIAHIGVLEALEEANIPIDFVAGTSAGAFISAMYASGYSPEQMKQIVLSEEFKRMSKGELTPETDFLLRREELNAGMFSLRVDSDSILRNPLPTNFVTPALMDFIMLEILGISGVNSHNNYDSLFVPFRCVAADIAKKESVTFRKGNLNQAVRASMTYPLYINPIIIDSILFFDGGLYNNFPADVMYEDFDVDYIIGSNVSYNAAAPDEDDIVGQLINMLVSPTDYGLPCESGIIIKPNTTTSTFNFDDAQSALDAGYRDAKAMIDSIRLNVTRKSDPEELKRKRKEYFEKQHEINIKNIRATDKYGKNIEYMEHSMINPSLKKNLNKEDLEKKYFRVYSTEQISFLYPTLSLNTDSTYNLDLHVKKEKNFKIDLGGHLSSRAVNMGYIGASFFSMNKVAMEVKSLIHFGKFYGAQRFKAVFDIPARLPFRFSIYHVRNNWDYFENFATFFEEVRPSFLVQEERYYGTTFSFPLGNKRTIDFDFRGFKQEDDYYQTETFAKSDTADITYLNGNVASINFNTNTLNRKQWASEGFRLSASAKLISAKERSISGSTSLTDYDYRRKHNWINFDIDGVYFPVRSKMFKFGFNGKLVLNGLFNTNSLLKNYTASILNTTNYAPSPDSKTYFLEDYRAPRYVGGGVNLIFSFINNVDIRIDPYIYQPIQEIIKLQNDEIGFSDFGDLKTMAAASVIFHSPLGPVRFTTNYFPVMDQPFNFQVSFGYVIFNDKAYR